MNKIYKIDKVLKYFYEISQIPRMSGKEEKIADYIEKFAQKKNLKYIRDIYNNIIITKEASNLSKSNESIILQCHMDMICEKEKYSDHDFERDPLKIYIDGDFIKAKNTTLGADNGIGIAIILAILDSNYLTHPRIEAIFTVQEETTMEGSRTIDVRNLKGNKMICLDNMREEELVIGCAGAKIFDYEVLGNKRVIDETYKLVKIEMSGFIGGHSGKDIAKDRGNPIKEMGRLLFELLKKHSIYIKDIMGGEKANVIPRECYSNLYIKADEFKDIKKEIQIYNESLKNKIQNNNETINVSINLIDENDTQSFDMNTTEKFIDIINSIPNGVYYEDKNNNPLVSLNIGKVVVKDSSFKLLFSIRSNRMEKEKQLINEFNYIVDKYNIKEKVSTLSGYEHKEKSEFVDKCKSIYKKYLKKNPKVIDMHICLEAGFFGEKIQKLDFIAIAPDIFDAHSPKERCSISSLKRIYNYIIIILQNL